MREFSASQPFRDSEPEISVDIETDEPSPEKAVVEADLASAYEREGLNVASAKASFERSRIAVENFDRFAADPFDENSWLNIGHEDSFYLNSSDSLPLLKRALPEKMERALTVIGSNDFLEVMIGRSRGIDAFDISTPGVLMAELKTVALRHLE
jgi:hypothetical protein